MSCTYEHKALAGRLRHRVTLQSPQRVSDGAGGYTLTWQNEATVWAAIDPVRVNERVTALQLHSEIRHKVTIRYRENVTAAMRVQFRTRVFNIRGVINPDEANHTLELLCEEGVAV